MKKVLLFPVSVFMCLFAYAQAEIVLSFEISQSGSQLLLDSVLIENQTNSTDTIIRWPKNSLTIDVLTGIESNSADVNSLQVMQNYPNPFDEKTYINVYNPTNEISINVYDISGKLILKEKMPTNSGINSFVFTPGADTHYLVSFNNGKSEQTIKMLHNGRSNRECKIEYLSFEKVLTKKNIKEAGFTYSENEILNFTSYTSACLGVETVTVSDSPVISDTITFDYTDLMDIQPDKPEFLTTQVTTSEIIWNWSAVNGADGYKYNTINDYETATDNGAVSELELSELSAGLNYHLFVWAYNECGQSFPLHIVEATTTTALEIDENNLIVSGTAGQDFELMYICEQPDSIVLRNQSLNVNLEEDNLQLLIDRMKTTVLGEGVGIAAPQIGINRNVIWVQRYDKGTIMIKPWEVYFNPVITAYSDTIAYRDDGCLSVSGDCVSQYDIVGKSYRSVWIDVQYYDINGNFVKERISQPYTAHIFQHEIDHLNGIMYFDRQVEEVPGKFVIIDGDSYEGLPPID
ncbi:MAG: peptide deformylase [Bacteroidales bacterium]|nr:peptide deformylase [Bacteroidales bacterium]